MNVAATAPSAPAGTGGEAPAAGTTPAAGAAPAAPNAGVTPAGASPASPDTTNPAPGTDLNGSGQGTGTNDDWTASLSADTRQLIEQKGYKTPDDLGKAYKALESKLGDRLEAPAEDAPKEAWDAFYDKLGRPKEAAEYQFAIPEGLPENIPYDSAFASEFRNWAHDAGLTPKQAATLHDRYVSMFAATMGQAQQQMGERVQSTHAALTQAWGAEDTEGYKENVEYARRALTQLDLKNSLASVGVLSPEGMVTDPKVAMALSRVGKAMFAEDTLYSGPGGIANNPFDAKTANLTQQSMLIKNDPAKAAQYIRAAGQKPEDYGLRG